MLSVTVTVAAVSSLLAVLLRPGAALAVVIGSMLIWPEYLRISVGLAEMSAPRIAAFALLVKLVYLGRHRRINFCSVDWLVIILWVWTIIAITLAGSEFSYITRHIGSVMDTVLIYMVARMAVRSAADFKSMVFPLLCVSAYMASMGWLEALTGDSPYMGLEYYRKWVWYFKEPEYRLGLMRAKVSTSVHIYFGMSMMLVASIAWSLRGHPRIKGLSILTAIVAGAGAMSSMSSGPWLAVIILVICNSYILYPRMIGPTLWFFLGVLVFLELASNRHFYNLIDYIALNPGTAWYRSRLLEVAASQWREYWLIGSGTNSISHWGALLDGRGHVDLVNNFIVIAVRSGLAGMFIYIFSHVNAIRFGLKTRKHSTDKVQRKAIFSLIAAIVALDIATMSAGLFGPALMLSYVLLGILVSVSVSWQSSAVPRKIPVGQQPGYKFEKDLTGRPT